MGTRTGQLDATYLTQPSGMIQRLFLLGGTAVRSPSKWQVEKPRLGKHVSVLTDLEAHSCWQVGGTIFPGRERRIASGHRRRAKTKTERTSAATSTGPTAPKPRGTDRRGLVWVAKTSSRCLA